MHESVSIAHQPQHSPTAAANEAVPLIDQQLDTETQLIDRFPIQLKLSVGAPNDPLEHEADAMADKVMRMPEMPFVQRKSANGDCCDYDDDHVRLKPLASHVTPFVQTKRDGAATVSESVSGRIKSNMGAGNSMSPNTRCFMETRFDADFSEVKIHTGSESVQLSRQLNAQAFTVSNHIYFNDGRYQPETDSGKHLLAHELTHVVQQSGGVRRRIQKKADKGEIGNYVIQRTPSRPYPSTAVIEREEMNAASRSRSLLSTSIIDWAVTDREAEEVLQILHGLNPESLLWVMMAMRMRGDWTTFVHELPEQDQSVLQDLLFTVDVNSGYILPGDDIRIETSINGHTEADLPAEYNVTRQGVNLPNLRTPVQIAGLRQQEAANSVAQAYMDAQVYFEPVVRLMVSSRGALYAPRMGPTSRSLWVRSTIQVDRNSIEVRRLDRQRTFMAYIALASSADAFTTNARQYYYLWIQQHIHLPDFLTMEPGAVWQLSLSQASAPPPQSPFQPFLDLMRRMSSRVRSAEGTERQTLNDALTRYIAWLDAHMSDPNIARFDPVEIWSSMYSQSFRSAMTRERERFLQEREQQQRDSPERQHQREAKFQEFYELAMQLWGYRSTHFPYRIPIPSEGRDILVWDDGRQVIFNQIANQLMHWGTTHMFDDNYVSAQPTVILSAILRDGNFERQLEAAASQPVAHESIDRHEIVASRALESFGRTVGTGLLVVGLLGAAVGLGVITGGTALVFMGGVAAYTGISAYMQRREEIERTGYEVPIPASMLASIGDVVGLSQLIEGLTGERIDSGRRLDSIERSDQLGAGGGSVVLLLAGSRAFRGGRSLGHSVGERAALRPQITTPGRLPAGPEGSVEFPGRANTPRPVIPSVSSRLGPVAERVRINLPPEIRVGFDMWVEETINNGGNPEQILNGMPEAARASRATRFANRFTDQLREAMRVEELRQRALDNPLNPLMAENRIVGDVRISYNRMPPAAHEIAQAQAIFNRTGEPIRLFGDTASGIQYPGIDGVIGEPPRPLSLKSGNPGANANYARWAAEQAYEAARTHGYTHVEVQIRMPGRTMAEIRAGWDAMPATPGQVAGGPYFDASQTVSQIVIEASDGIITMNTPPTGAVPPVGLPVGVHRPDEAHISQ